MIYLTSCCFGRAASSSVNESNATPTDVIITITFTEEVYQKTVVIIFTSSHRETDAPVVGISGICSTKVILLLSVSSGARSFDNN